MLPPIKYLVNYITNKPYFVVLFVFYYYHTFVAQSVLSSRVKLFVAD